MEYKWNVEELKKLHQEKEEAYSKASAEEKTIYALDIKALDVLLTLVSDITNTNIGDLTEYNRNLKNKMVDNQMELEPLETIKAIKDEVPLKPLPKIIVFKKGIEVGNSISIVKNVSLPNLIDTLDDVIDKNGLEVSNKEIVLNTCARAISSYLYSDKKPYIYLRRENNISDMSFLAHELGHILQYKSQNNAEAIANYNSSYLNELVPILQEMILVHDLKDTIPEPSRLYLQKALIDNLYYTMIVTTDEKTKGFCSPYVYSMLVACYIYSKYCTNKYQFADLHRKYMQLALDSSDMKILDELNINYDDLKDALKFYLDQYKEDVSKIRKIGINHIVL